MSIRPASKPPTSIKATDGMQYSLADDLSGMAAYGSFMFLLNELRHLAAEADEEKAKNGEAGDGKDLFPSDAHNPTSADWSDANDDNGAQSSPFAPILTFPLCPSAMESVVRSNADRLIELQGPKRHDAHLQMCDYFKNRDCSAGDGDGDGDEKNEEEAQNSSVRHSEPIFLDYNEESAEGEDHLGLVYSLVLDHTKRRITVVFRGSVTASDWAANRDAYFVTVENPRYTGKKKDGDSEGGGNDDTDDEVDAKGQPRQLILHRGFYEYVYKSIGAKEDDGDDDTMVESQDQKQVGEDAQKSAKATIYPTNDAIPRQDQQARTKARSR